MILVLAATDPRSIDPVGALILSPPPATFTVTGVSEAGEQVERGRDGGLVEPAFGQQGPDPSGHRDGVRPGRNTDERDPGQPALVSLAALGGTRLGGLALAGPLLALGFGLGGIITPLFATIVTGVTPAENGSAAGSLGAVQQLARSVGVAALAMLYTAAAHPAAHGLAVTALATAALLTAGAALTFLLPSSGALSATARNDH